MKQFFVWVNLRGQRLTFYEFFGVKETCTDEELKRAYLFMCKKYHPDKVQDSKEKLINEKIFKVIQHCWEIFKSQRKKYDQELSIARGIKRKAEESKVVVRFNGFYSSETGGTTETSTFWYT